MGYLLRAVRPPARAGSIAIGGYQSGNRDLVAEFIEGEVAPVVRAVGSSLPGGARVLSWFRHLYTPDLTSRYMAAHPIGILAACFAAGDEKLLVKLAKEAVGSKPGAFVSIHVL